MHKCKICGKSFEERIFLESSDSADCCSHECFMINFWNAKVDWNRDGDIHCGCKCARINGRHYVIGDEPKDDEDRRSLGHGGAEFTIRFTSGPHEGQTVVTQISGLKDIP